MNGQVRALSETDLHPLTDRVLVRRIHKPERTAGGIYRTERAQEISQLGRVLAVGPDAEARCGMPLVGRAVIFSVYASTPWVDDEDVIFVRSGDLLAVWEELDG